MLVLLSCNDNDAYIPIWPPKASINSEFKKSHVTWPFSFTLSIRYLQEFPNTARSRPAVYDLSTHQPSCGKSNVGVSEKFHICPENDGSSDCLGKDENSTLWEITHWFTGSLSFNWTSKHGRSLSFLLEITVSLDTSTGNILKLLPFFLS